MKALILGATGGIGKAIAKHLDKDGYEIVIHHNTDIESADELEKELNRSKKIKCDLRDETQVKVMCEMIQEMDIGIIVNCATGPIEYSEAVKRPWEDFKRQIDIQLKAFHSIVSAAAERMKTAKEGQIVSVLSEYVIGKPPERIADYITAKYALMGFTKVLACELGKYGIRCNSVSPGIINTKLTERVPPKLFDIVGQQTPLKRTATTEDVANTIRFLCSKESGFINGENILVNGGYVMN